MKKAFKQPLRDVTIDETELIDFNKLYRMTRWIYATGWEVAQADTRPSIDQGWTYSR